MKWHSLPVESPEQAVDAFEPADGASANEWQAATFRYRHVFQRAADARAPIYLEREA